MNCPRCQSDNPPNAAFCDQCGARLETACPNCGESNRHGAKFCRNCGHTITEIVTTAATAPGVPAPGTYVPKYLAEKILATRHTLEGERKQDRKSTRLNSSHMSISYAVFCLKKKKRY